MDSQKNLAKQIGVQIKLWRLLYGFAIPFIIFQAVVFCQKLISGVFNLVSCSKENGISLCVINGIRSFGQFLLSSSNIGVIVSLAIVTYILGIYTQVFRNTPVKRFQILADCFRLTSLFHTFFMGIASALFVQSVGETFGMSLVMGHECKTIEKSSPEIADSVCVNEKHFFVLSTVMMLTMFEFVMWKVNGCNTLNFHHINEPVVQRLKFYIIKNWMSPMKRTLLGYSIHLVIYNLAIRDLFFSTVYFWRKVAFVDGTMNSWFDAFEIELVLKTLICSYVGLCLFSCQWECLNVLFEKSNKFKITVAADPSFLLSYDAISSKDNYVRAWGWLDLTSICKDGNDKLSSIFTLSHPGNKAHNWDNIVNQCVALGYEQINEFSTYVSNQVGKSKTAAGSSSAGVRVVKGVTLYTDDAPFVQDTPDPIRRRHNHELRDLASTVQLPERSESRLTIWDIILICPVLFNRFFANCCAFVVAKCITNVQGQSFLDYWIRNDTELEISKLFSETELFILSLTGVVDATCYAINCQFNPIVQRDVSRINKLFVDYFKTFHKIGGIVPKKISKLSINNEPIELYCDIKEEHNRLLETIRFSVAKYTYHVMPYFEILGIPVSMKQQIQSIVDG